MKHSLRIILILLGMFFITQLIGLAVISQYSPEVIQVKDEEGNLVNKTIYNLPYGAEPPAEVSPVNTLVSIIIAVAVAVIFMLILMRYKAEFFLRSWFFIVVSFALGISIYAFIDPLPFSQLIALIIAIPLAALKLFKRNIIVHNITELFIYPGIASVFVPLLNIWTVVLLLILISIYDIYAVWHAGFMQKMAQYQIKKLKFFTGFFVPYLGSKERAQVALAKQQGDMSKLKNKKIKVNVAILGGGDVVFPIILAGVVFNTLGLLEALIINLGATLALAWLFYISKKGKFYPAMPFISAGCLIALGIALII
ncbi:MAG: presenilin family intramembrane aspartyl protease [Nanoarchaeota archaeon]|nr:presenilin family intramembrane aspartyl protease [Nanoarchaeota archaeon]